MSLLPIKPSFAAPSRQWTRAFSCTASRPQDSNPISSVLQSLSTRSPPRQQLQSRQPSRTPLADPSAQSTGSQPPRTSTHAYASSLLRQSEQTAAAKAQRAETLREVDESQARKDMELQQSRRWRIGEVYAPHDLSGVEASKWKKTRRRPTADVFDALGINPLKEYKNFALMSEYMSEMGRIKHSRETGLRPVNQRKLAKAIRRAIGIGLMPSVHRHPEILGAVGQSFGR